jgi:hypothetical protein
MITRRMTQLELNLTVELRKTYKSELPQSLHLDIIVKLYVHIQIRI